MLRKISTWLLIEFQTKFQHYSPVFGKVMVPDPRWHDEVQIKFIYMVTCNTMKVFLFFVTGLELF